MSEPQNSPENIENQDLLEGEKPQIEGAELLDSPSKKQPMGKVKEIKLIPRIGLYAISFIVVVMVVWGIGALIIKENAMSSEAASLPTPWAEPFPSGVPTPSFSTEGQAGGVYRLADLEIAVISQPDERDEVTKYTVEPGDTIFGIAEKFGLKPETVLWSNRYIIGDHPAGLSIGVELFILPVDGVYHMWEEGEGLNGVASFYGVSPDVIVNYPGNDLDPAIVGDYANPNIEPGKMLVVPDGERPTVAWIVPRDAPASMSRSLGPGTCAGTIYGDVGTGSFTWPTTETWLSGYDYNPPVHNGLDFGGNSGNPIYASDSGVIVYSGWSPTGYGYLIVVDHGYGWQSFYAHMIGGTLAPCGSNVRKGQLIGSMGSTGNSTGPHLHFELRLEGYPVNPWQFLN